MCQSPTFAEVQVSPIDWFAMLEDEEAESLLRPSPYMGDFINSFVTDEEPSDG